MLKLVSRFVLEVLPYLLTAVIAAVVVPGFLYSQVYGTKAAVAASVPTSGVNAPELVSGDHARVCSGPHAAGRVHENGRRKGGISLTARS